MTSESSFYFLVMRIMNIENVGNLATSLVSGTVVGILIGYAVKKVLCIVLRIGLVMVGIFFAALTYLQFQGVLNVNWDKVKLLSKNTIMGVINSDVTGTNSILSNLRLPLTGSMAVGFAVGFMKG